MLQKYKNNSYNSCNSYFFYTFAADYFILLQHVMMLELHNVTIGELIKDLSATIEEGQIVGMRGKGKSTLLRAIMGLIPVSSGHICIDGEMLTQKSATYFRRFLAYVPQRISVPEGFTKVPTDYVELLRLAVQSNKKILLVDEPDKPLNSQQQEEAARIMSDAANDGRIVLTVFNPLNDNYIDL